jgi:hypothetical protein
MERLESRQLLTLHGDACRDDEVDVRVLVCIAECERALEVRPDKVVAESIAHAVDEVGEKRV